MPSARTSPCDRRAFGELVGHDLRQGGERGVDERRRAAPRRRSRAAGGGWRPSGARRISLSSRARCSTCSSPSASCARRSPSARRRRGSRRPGARRRGANRALRAGRGFEDALAGLDAWDYAWVLFVFHRNVEQGRGWKPKVQPPRADAKVGVFATRSPHRPNPIGMSAVRIERVEGLVVHVRDLDLLDGTPGARPQAVRRLRRRPPRREERLARGARSAPGVARRLHGRGDRAARVARGARRRAAPGHRGGPRARSAAARLPAHPPHERGLRLASRSGASTSASRSARSSSPGIASGTARASSRRAPRPRCTGRSPRPSGGGERARRRAPHAQRNRTSSAPSGRSPCFSIAPRAPASSMM